MIYQTFLVIHIYIAAFSKKKLTYLPIILLNNLSIFDANIKKQETEKEIIYSCH